MIHITKAKEGLMVVTTSPNGRVVHTSEILKTKSSCRKNIISAAAQYGSKWVLFQDDTLLMQLKPCLFEARKVDEKAWKIAQVDYLVQKPSNPYNKKKKTK